MDHLKVLSKHDGIVDVCWEVQQEMDDDNQQQDLLEFN